MRPIKFRGLHPDKNGDYFVYGFPTQDLPNSTAYYDKFSCRIHWHHENGGTANAPILNGTLSQFTGLLDKNGKEIFEGDKVKGLFNEKRNTIYSVYFHQEVLAWFLQSETDMNIHLCDLSEIEIVGNIYESPELLSN